MLVPAIHFPGTCKDAIALYERAFGAQIVHISYNRDAPPESDIYAENDDRVMHAEISIDGMRVNMCDVGEEVIPGNMHLFNLFLTSADDVRRAYEHVADGGEVLTELGPQFWASMYASVVDRFGVHWQLMVGEG